MPNSKPSTARARRDHLLLAHQALVRPLALHYALLSPEPLEDLIQVGQIGLLRAAEGYDPKADVPFARYAKPHIRGAILHHLRDRAWLVRLPRRQAELWQHWAQGRHGLQAAAQSSASQEALLRWRSLNRAISLESLNLDCGDQANLPFAPIADLGDTCSGEVFVPRSLTPDWQHCSVAQMLAMVNPKQRQVLQCVVLQGWSYRRTAETLKVSAATVQRLLHRALDQLRARLSCPQPNPAPHSGRRAPSAVGAC